MSGATSIVVAAAVVAGIMVTVQAQMIAALEVRLGSVPAVTLTFMTGGVLAAGLLAFLRPDVSAWRTVPWWAWLGGVAGLVLVFGLSYAVPRIGVTSTLTVIIAVQLAVALLFEHFGWLEAVQRPVDLWRLVGLVLLAIGAWLVVR